MHEEYETLDVEQTVLPFADRLAEAGGTDLLLNADPYGGWKERLPKPEELAKRQGDNLTRIAELVAPLGLKLSLHNHAADRHNAEMDLRSVVEFAAPFVGLCIDAGWAHVAGCDPVEWVRRWPERIAAFHLRNQRGRVPAEDLLEGDIDFAALLQAAADADYRGWLALELWHPAETAPVRSMTEDVQRSIAYLQTLLAQQGAGA
jgi:sugar phosphate isomerase/epimerase